MKTPKRISRYWKRKRIEYIRKLDTHDMLYWLIRKDWGMVHYYITKIWRRKVRWPINKFKFRVRYFWQLRQHPHNKWFYHWPTFVPKGSISEEEYIWCDCWGCGCCIRKIGLCTLTKIDDEYKKNYDPPYFYKDGKPDPLTIFYTVKGVDYALTFHHDNPPYGLLEGTKYLSIECFMRLNEYPDEDKLERGYLDADIRRTY